ncbi:MAG: PEPxxWA-CTERM sorting domain-containing protein [Sphingomonadaceae bacterium]|nr:PEPxxWA-CTERM sorting domain-containing protein [Sphingomonadaceae bacterium]
MIKFVLPVAALLAAGSAQALTWTSVNGAPDPGPGANQQTFVDFETPVDTTGFTLTGNYALASGTTGSYAAPAGDASTYLYVSSALAGNNATLTAPAGLKSIGFYWGSVDTYNSVDVLGTRGGVATTLYTLAGSSLPLSNGDQQSPLSNQRVTFVAGRGEAITGLRFVSTGVAYEIDNVAGTLLGNGSASAVPEPAAWALLLVGFGVVGATARRRRMAPQVSA